MAKIIKAEYWRQVRLFQDFLRVILAEGTDQKYIDRSYNEYRKLAGQVTEFLWQRTRTSFPMVQKQAKTASNNVTVLGNFSLPNNVRKILDKGPKYSFDPGAQRHQLLAMARRAATCTSFQERERATSDAVNCVMSKAATGSTRKPPLRMVR
ncbi:hypothetical protein HPB52_001116 [Rhipicephalus sanguineus]|uniref:Uncharacterized protein n=1 Tax=Rhipicephalus sanguineus TaxID=34632 RepID=A0A9D4QHS4_RHISA|nr:hypothetical protein HPB52_001116 [Rhipicephalus sanguineus]